MGHTPEAHSVIGVTAIFFMFFVPFMVNLCSFRGNVLVWLDPNNFPSQ